MAFIRSRETSNGPRYDVRYRANGKEWAKTFRSYDDAKTFRKKVQADELAGIVVNPKGGDRRFGEYAADWIERRLVKGRSLTPATRQGYRALLRRHLGPAFGGMKLRQITPERIRRWQTELSERSPDQAAKAYRVLRAIMNTAVPVGAPSPSRGRCSRRSTHTSVNRSPPPRTHGSSDRAVCRCGEPICPKPGRMPVAGSVSRAPVPTTSATTPPRSSRGIPT